jgi:dihydrofolate reductase
MTYEIIVACDLSGLIGINGNLPWNIRSDMTRFKKTTENHIVVMGRKTRDSIPGGFLSNRINIVMTKNPEQYSSSETVLFTNIENAIPTIEIIREKTKKRVFIIGGAEIYRHFLPYCNTVHLTLVHKHVEYNSADSVAYFPLETVNLSEKYKVLEKSDLFYNTCDLLRFQFITYCICVDTK